MEEWKAIDGTNGVYAVSSVGKVMNTKTGRVLKAQTDQKGYLRVRITVERQGITLKIHREVAKAFIPNPDNLPQVNHINGDKTDNRVENLEWISNLENARHAIANNLWENVFLAGQRANENRKTPIIATCIDTGEEKYFESMSDAEREIGTKHINSVMKGERSQAKGHTFRYANVGGDANARDTKTTT